MKSFLAGVFIACTSMQAQDGLGIEAVRTDRGLWPREVTIHVPHEVPVVVNGKASGSMKAPAGRVYRLQTVVEQGVTIDALGVPLTFPVAETDLLVRAEQIAARRKALAEVRQAASPPPASVPSSSPAASPETVVSQALAGTLVALDGKKLTPFDATQLGGKKYYAVYRSASWCGPCRTFTPELVKWYKRKKSAHDQFEVILVSSDHSEEDMIAYMAEDKMEWPALDYAKRGNHLPITGVGGRGIPDLIVLDATGKVLLSSYQGETYIGPRKVLDDFEKLLKK